MNCHTIELDILLESTGELSAARVSKLHRHMDQCAHCRAFAGDLATLHRAVASNTVNAPDAVAARVLATAARQPIPAASAFLLTPRSLMALAATLVIGIGLWLSIRNIQVDNQSYSTPTRTRLTEISDIIFAITDSEQWSEQWGDRQMAGMDIEALAQQILVTQGMDVDFLNEPEEAPNSLEEHPPTTLLWHSSPEPLAEICG